jgi:hypothetical protein
VASYAVPSQRKTSGTSGNRQAEVVAGLFSFVHLSRLRLQCRAIPPIAVWFELPHACSAPRRRRRPGDAWFLSLQRTEGAGKAGRPMRPQPRMQKWKAYEQVTTGSPDRSGLPCAMVLTVSFVISPVTGLSCHRRQRDARHRRQLDASVGASGPHDFAVREVSAFVSRATRVHRIPRPTFVTIAIRPSETRRDGWNR